MTPTAYPTPGQNGHYEADPHRGVVVSALLGDPLSEGYRPSLPPWLYTTEGLPVQVYLFRDIELMSIHPVCMNALNYFKSGIAAVEFDVADGGAAQDFILDQCQRYWDRGVPLIQGGYDYGWIGCETVYASEQGTLAFDDVIQFSPRDTFLLTQGNKPIGVRVKNVVKTPEQCDEDRKKPADREENVNGQVDLWLASEDVPAKGLWYAHEPRWNSWYGRSQYLGAWKPWRRLAWKDGAETVADTGVYRFAYAGPIVKYPNEDLGLGPTAGSPSTTPDSTGLPRRYARDVARQIAEQVKAGAGIGIPSQQYTADQGGGPKWDVEFPKSTLNIDGLIAYIKHLWSQISYGVGVPPELLDGEESGGYSGRKIPREAFLMRQQRIADALLRLFEKQVLRPLVRWNYGDINFKVKVKNLLMSERKAMTGQEEGQPGVQPAGLPQQSPTLGRPDGYLDARGMDNVPQPQEGPGAFSLVNVRGQIEAVAARVLAASRFVRRAA